MWMMESQRCAFGIKDVFCTRHSIWTTIPLEEFSIALLYNDTHSCRVHFMNTEKSEKPEKLYTCILFAIFIPLSWHKFLFICYNNCFEVVVTICCSERKISNFWKYFLEKSAEKTDLKYCLKTQVEAVLLCWNFKFKNCSFLLSN